MAKFSKEEIEVIARAAELATTMEDALPEKVNTEVLIAAYAMQLAHVFLRTGREGVTRDIIKQFIQQFGDSVLLFYDHMEAYAEHADNQGNKSDKYKTIE
jgi:hypothetical protein